MSGNDKDRKKKVRREANPETKNKAENKREMKEKKEKKEKKPGSWKIFVPIIGILVVLVIIAVVVFFHLRTKKQNADMEQALTELAQSSIDSVTAKGVINIGSTEETLDIENMTTSLQIEEVLVSSGDSVTAGDVLLRFTEDSVAEAKKELEKNLKEKDLDYRSGAISYEKSLITAKYDYDSTVLKGEQADAVYDETVASLKESLEASTKTYNEAVEQLAEYKDAQANNTYYTEYKVEYYKQVYDENRAILEKKVEEWGIDWNDITRGNSRPGADLTSQYKYVLQSLYSILETNLRDYENALENYENDSADLNYNLLSLQLNMSTLEETYLNAKKSYETSLLTAEETRQTSKTNAELAESTYEATVEKAKTDYESLKSAYEEAKSDYDTFTERIVDNCYIAANTGSVMRSNIRSGGTVSAGSRILTYSDLEDITVSVSVDQADIAKLAVGDTAICYASSSGLLNGTIQSISPVTQSDSISSVTYSVTVKIAESGDSVSANTTVTVLFGADMTTAAGMNLSALNRESSESGFDFSSMFGSGNMPDASNFGDFSGGGFPGGGFSGGNPFN